MESARAFDAGATGLACRFPTAPSPQTGPGGAPVRVTVLTIVDSKGYKTRRSCPRFKRSSPAFVSFRLEQHTSSACHSLRLVACSEGVLRHDPGGPLPRVWPPPFLPSGCDTGGVRARQRSNNDHRTEKPGTWRSASLSGSGNRHPSGVIEWSPPLGTQPTRTSRTSGGPLSTLAGSRTSSGSRRP